MRTMVGPKIRRAQDFALFQIVGDHDETAESRLAAWAAVLLARLPVLAQPTVSKPNSMALVIGHAKRRAPCRNRSDNCRNRP